MKKIFLFVFAALFAATMDAKVILTESFERSVGTLCIGTNTDMGTNTDDWWSYSGSSNYIQVAEGTLSFPGYAKSGKGNKAYLGTSGADDLRQFKNEYTSGKVYLAAIVNVEAVKGSATADYCLALGDASASNMYARLYTKSEKEGDEWTGFRFGVSKYSESASYVGVTEEVYSPNTDYLVVLEYEFVDGEKNDTARLYVNPTKETTVPTLVCVQSVQSGSGAEQGAMGKNDASKISSVNLRQGSNTPKIFIDEIKIATSWEELFSDEGGDTPGGDTPEEDDPLIVITDDNLLLNNSFEEYSCSAIFGCSFEDWNLPLNTSNANSSDKLDGNNSIQINPSMASTLDQGVLLNDATYAAGTRFTLTLNYKILSMPEGEALKMDCYWEAAAGGDADAIKAHDAAILTGELENGTAWKHKVVTTSKPAKSAYLRVRVTIPKNAKVLFDALALVKEDAAPGEPFIEVTPLHVSPVNTTVGNTATFETIHVKQGNVTSKTTFYIGGANADQFSLSATELPADQTDIDLIITYAPTGAGTHTAALIFDNAQHTTILPDMISLSGSCTDPSAQPKLTLTPSELPAFEVLEGKQQTQTITLSSINCVDYIYAHVDHVQGAGFTIDGTMFSKNTDVTVTVTFAPQVAGSYQSTVTFYSEGAESVVLTLNGTGIPKTPETIDWQTEFVWNESNPLSWMYEQFNDISHNETLILEGWQNVAAADQRPWWGFDASKTQTIEGDGKFAKATAYQFGKESTGTWEMWLATPPLDFKNAGSKIFAFSVMGQYLSDEGSESKLEVYYIDPLGEPTAYFQDLTESFDIPRTSDRSESWSTFYLDLAPYAETVADVFHMAFRFVGPNGSDGAVTYYLDDVSWGRTDLPLISPDVAQIVETAVVNEEKVVGQITVSTQSLTQSVNVAIKGANYDKFTLSAESVPAEGGTITVSFKSDEIGVHEAYVELSSSEAPTVYVPISVLCQSAEGIDEVQEHAQSTKILRDGLLLIERNGVLYNAQGVRVKE